MKEIAKFQHIHKGKRLFILASGPSLKSLDLSRLERRIVMGMNRSFLTYPKTHYHCVMDHRLFELYEKELHETRYLFTLQDRPWGIPMELLGSEGFSWELEKGVYSGYTISYVALQVAVYMGFQEIYFLGLDLKHEGTNTHFFGHDFHSENHETTEFPKMEKMLTYAATSLKDSNVQVFNCSPVSTLTCFPKISFEEAISR